MLDQVRGQLFQTFLRRRALEDELAQVRKTEDALIAQVGVLEQVERLKAAEAEAALADKLKADAETAADAGKPADTPAKESTVAS